MREQGQVSKILNDRIVLVEFSGNENCEKCGACLKYNNKNYIEAVNEVQAKVLDKVEIEIQSGSVLWATLLVFIMPVISMIIGYYAGGILFSFVFLFIYFVLLRGYNRLIIKRESPCRVVKIL